MSDDFRIDRRTAIQWVAMASALPWLQRPALGTAGAPAAEPYGTDPRLNHVYKPGDLWPLTLPPYMRAAAAALCDVIIPADAESPAASAVGVVDFIDEWISAPYPDHAVDRKTVLDGLGRIEADAQRRFSASFAKLSAAQMSAIADAMIEDPFFVRYRALTAGGFYTTPVGFRDLKYVGNVPMAQFEGPTPEILKRLGLA